MELGKLKPIALRRKWPNEASDFTPFNSETSIQEALSWLTDYTIKFREVFGGIIKNYKE